MNTTAKQPFLALTLISSAFVASAMTQADLQGLIDAAEEGATVEVATAADASCLLPKTIDVGEAGRAALPHLFTGVAKGVTGEVALEGCDFDELKAAGLLPLTLLSCSDGAFTGKVKFILPEGCRDKLVAKRRGDRYVFDEKQGILVIVR